MLMGVSGMVVKIAVCALLGCVLVGGPLVLVDRMRARRRAAIARQIALTDALDAQFGALVAPMVRKPLFGPWEVWMAVPRLGSSVLAGILTAADAVFAGLEGTPQARYRMVLHITANSSHAGPDRRAPRPTPRWAGTPAAA
jgi:hypothetical protein